MPLPFCIPGEKITNATQMFLDTVLVRVLVVQSAARSREAGENPARCRHCEREVPNIQGHSGNPGKAVGGARTGSASDKPVSQETCLA